ncbi:bifunctional formaldehyde-activating protein/3-hexulose-6-phosphate synthase [candidate division MSBL1 archaeon SCGC-AAA259A05]|uniref:Bifunctional enzyme Fae/Hps n=1 Tax=candidate division MSBL1 archaeon SCGC-AAA259A05 TaxID=1698259 RepID=A0A133U990_9EURY|nr:bifunctional formaldehyde-activating protein/3-hexulose-6-phosphate synthase [candidate division MSBL1 archaeon SCGC-AAA259A05]
MYKVGEALVGDEPNLAHIDLVIGEKDGPVGQAFLNGISQPSKGHTPLLSVIRPDLQTKPSTLIVPKVTVQGMEDADKAFGPVQEGVARAVADSVEEGIIPKDRTEELVIIVSVFIHPEASDFQKLNRFNYGATRLAIRRAMEEFPSIDKVFEEKDKAGHPLMGTRTVKLRNPPYLQVAMDKPSLEQQLNVIQELPENDHLIVEAGTPLIKKYGISVVEKLREKNDSTFIIADLKTLDTGHLEARMAADAGADGVVVSGLADKNTIEKATREADKCGIYCIVDTLNVSNPVVLLKELEEKPHIVELHRGIDQEYAGEEHSAWGDIPTIKELTRENLVAVAGGITKDTIREALESGADIIVVGRAIANSKDPESKTRDFLEAMGKAYSKLEEEKFGDIEQFRWRTDF